MLAGFAGKRRFDSSGDIIKPRYYMQGCQGKPKLMRGDGGMMNLLGVTRIVKDAYARVVDPVLNYLGSPSGI